MIAGKIGMLRELADGPIEDHFEPGYRGIDVDQSTTYLDGYRIQEGTVAGRVTKQAEDIHVGSAEIDVETINREQQVATDFVADVERDGWIIAERTHATDEEHRPDWPFSQFETRLGVEIEPMGFDVAAFVERQADDGYTPEMATISGESDDTRIDWGRRVDSNQAERADVGVALTTRWNGEFVRLVIYESGYTAIWEDLPPHTVGRFVHEELAPVAVPLEETEETEQQEVTA